jgi:hypothetical protein
MAARLPRNVWIDCPSERYAAGPYTADRAEREMARLAADERSCHYPHQLVTSDRNPYAGDGER